MKKITPGVHGILDYLTVLSLLISPSLFEMQVRGLRFTYVLASVHLVLTLFTDFKAGPFKLIPFKIHGLIEIIVSISLIGIAIWFRASGDNVSFYYYLIFSVVLFIVWAASEYKPLSPEIADISLKNE
jgi:hypothetical protein